jgi:hypothetical protein
MTDDFEDDPLLIEIEQLVAAGHTRLDASAIAERRERERQRDAEAADWANGQYQAAWNRLVTAHPLFHVPLIDDAF